MSQKFMAAPPASAAAEAPTLEQLAERARRGPGLWTRFRRNRLAVLGALLLIVLYGSALFAPVISPYDPDAVDLRATKAMPSLQHPFGTDRLGRDTLARSLYGGRISLSIGLVAVGISVVIGVLLGAVAGFYGRAVDNVITAAVDVLLSIPSLFLLIIAVSFYRNSGLASLYLIMAVIGLTSWMRICRLVRGEVLSLKEREFVQAARLLGNRDAGIVWRHILPNTFASIIVAATLGVGSIIIFESSLSFLGLGVQPPTATWGSMLREAQSVQILAEQPWIAFFPGLLIVLTVLGFNFLGDGLRDALDPFHSRRA